jgi:hypothetical protein
MGTQMNADYHDFLIMLKEKILYSAISYFNLNNYYLRLSAFICVPNKGL